MAVEYFCAYHSYLDALEPLTDAERGRLFVACLKYSKSGEVGHLSGNERFVFPVFRGQIDRDNAKYASRCKKQSENISRRWNKSDTNDTNAYNGIPNIPLYENDTDDTKEKENEKTKEKAKENAKEKEEYISAPKCASPPAPASPTADTHTPEKADSPFSPFCFSPAVDAKLRQWFVYKSQRGEGYTPQGKQALLSQLSQQLNTYPESAVCALIDECMAAGWKTIVFERLAKNPAAYSGAPNSGTARRPLDADEQAAIRRMFGGGQP